MAAEVFDNMVEATPIAYNAWDQIFILGQTSLDQMQAVCQQIQLAHQQGR